MGTNFDMDVDLEDSYIRNNTTKKKPNKTDYIEKQEYDCTFYFILSDPSSKHCDCTYIFF